MQDDDALLEGQLEVEVEGEEPLEVEIEIPPAALDQFDVNLAEHLSEETLLEIGSERKDTYTNLRDMREDWQDTIVKGVKLLGLSIDDEDIPVEGGCSAVHPLVLENAIKFEAKAIQELWPARGPVKTNILGKVSPEAEQQASRVRKFMNFQLCHQIPGFYGDTERNLLRLAFVGTGVRKTGWNKVSNRLDPSVVYIENFFVDPAVTHLSQAEEYTQLMPLSERVMQNYQLDGQFREIEDDEAEDFEDNKVTEALNKAQGFDSEKVKRGFLVGEAHCYLDLKGKDPLVEEGRQAPYIVHFNVNSGVIYSIRRNWRPDDSAKTRRQWYSVDYFVPGINGFYGFGLFHLIGDLANAATATMRALIDAGQFANFPAGFKSKSAKLTDKDARFRMGEFKDVNLTPEELAKAFFPLPFKEPSQTLFQLLEFIVNAGQKFADTTDQVISESTNYGPVATTLALIEESQKFYSSLHKRLHASQGEFFKLLAQLNYDNLSERVDYSLEEQSEFVLREDFNPETVDVIPASDPNSMSSAQRVAIAQILLETAAKFPQLHDLREALKRFYGALGTDDVDKLMPPPEEPFSGDPLSEIQAAMGGKPIAAQIGQHHDAHIFVKEAFLNMPNMQGGLQDPSLAGGIQLLSANVKEHKVLMFIEPVMAMMQQMGEVPQEMVEQAQAQAAQLVLQLALEQSGQPPANIEERMLALNEKELELAAARIASQDAREMAKIAQKDEELALKKLTLAKDIAEGQQELQLDVVDKKLKKEDQEADKALRFLEIQAKKSQQRKS